MASGGSIGNDPWVIVIVLALIGIFTLGAMLWHAWNDKSNEEKEAEVNVLRAREAEESHRRMKQTMRNVEANFQMKASFPDDWDEEAYIKEEKAQVEKERPERELMGDFRKYGIDEADEKELMREIELCLECYDAWENESDRRFLKGIEMPDDLVVMCKWHTAYVKYWHKRQLTDNVEDKVENGPRKFADMTPDEFEDAVCKLFNAFGYNLSVTQRSKDGGIDLDGLGAGLGQARVVVQCKRYSSPVGVSVVRELFGVVSDDPEIAEGFLVTTNTFTQEAQAFARGKRITLVDGAELEMRFSKLAGADFLKFH